MQHATQVALARQIFAHLDAGTTCQADDIATNPVEAYTSVERLSRERTRLFREYPQYLGLSCLLREPGDYLTNDDIGPPILAVRGEDGAVRAFYNVCRHRGARVASGCGNAGRRLRCPYHGWAYGLDGALAGVPDQKSFAGLDRASHGLVPLPAVERHGMIWVSPVPDQPLDVDAHLGDLGPEIASFGLEGYQHYDTRVMRRHMNWKMVIDTFLESYHFAALHTETVDPLFFPNLCLFDAFGPHLREAFARRTITAMRPRPESEWDLVTHTALVYLLFPNAVLVIQGDHVEIWRIYPAGDRVDESIIHLELYTPEPATSESARGHWDRNMDLVVKVVEEEDFPIGEGIQRGFAAGAQAHVTYGRNEPALQHWQKTAAAAVAD